MGILALWVTVGYCGLLWVTVGILVSPLLFGRLNMFQNVSKTQGCSQNFLCKKDLFVIFLDEGLRGTRDNIF